MRVESTQKRKDKRDDKMWAGVYRTLQVTDEELDKIYYKKLAFREKKSDTRVSGK